MAARVPSASQQLEERISLEIQSVDGPLTDEHRGLLQQLEDVDSRGFHGRTLLHVAIREGKKYWTGALLARGADPCIRDGEGVDAVMLAEDMVTGHPGDTGRADILMMVRMVQARDGARSVPGIREGTAGVSAGSGSGSDAVVMTAVRSLTSKMDSLLKYFSERYNALDERLTSLSDKMESTDKKVSELKANIPNIEERLTSITQGIEKTNDELRSTDSKVTDLATVTRETNTKIGILHGHFCDVNPSLVVETMMRVTFIMDQNEEKRKKMLRLYGRLQEEGELTSSLLRFFASGRRVEVHVDFDSDDIGRMKERARDEDGIEKGGSEFIEHADVEEGRVYLGGEWNDDFVSSYLARGLARMAIHLAFNNGGRPYSEGDAENRTRFQNILGEGMEKSDRGGWDMHLTFALRLETPLGREIRLSIAVAEMIALYGSADGTSRLRRHLPSLLTFYEEHVLPALRTGDARV